MGLKLCGPWSVQTPDVEGDTFKLEGMSIAKVNEAAGICNYDHGKEARNIIGRTFNVKKIFNKSDCKTPQELRIFQKNNELPIIYGCVELFNQEGHEEAKAVASIVEHYRSQNMPLPLGWSVEVEPVAVSQDKVYSLSVLKRTSITHKPVHQACFAEVLEEPQLPTDPPKGIQKSETELVKSKEEEQDMNKSELDEKLATVLGQLCDRAHEISKALEAGYAVGPAGTNTQGAALQRPGSKKKAKVEEAEESTTEESEEGKPTKKKSASAIPPGSSPGPSDPPSPGPKDYIPGPNFPITRSEGESELKTKSFKEKLQEFQLLITKL